jgi:hypothetical protein
MYPPPYMALLVITYAFHPPSSPSLLSLPRVLLLRSFVGCIRFHLTLLMILYLISIATRFSCIAISDCFFTLGANIMQPLLGAV